MKYTYDSTITYSLEHIIKIIEEWTSRDWELFQIVSEPTDAIGPIGSSLYRHLIIFRQQKA